MSERTPLTYADAGVDIDAGNRLVDAIREPVEATRRPEVIGGLGGFGGLFELPVERYRRPVLVSGTDGVGTKLRLAIDNRRYDGIGIDLVAMCVNDVLVTGAEPLFFLDYYATARLDAAVAAPVIRSIAEGCRQAGAALIGGETAEMPGMYGAGDFDLAGFCVGVVEYEARIDGSGMTEGDTVIGLASSGPHSNGYSLIRRILETHGAGLDTPVGDTTLADALLAPTRIYVSAIHALLERVDVRGMAHITGGGLAENLARVIPEHLGATLERDAWPRPPVFDWLAEAGNVSEAEMQRTFNCGIGYCVIVPSDQVAETLDVLAAAGEQAWRLGEIRRRDPHTDAVRLV
ncbi:phosphoribosylformylglycinamidine cyclo-ligase [Salinisphaera orenii]|uniref:Phosphoribosylformylglycinamidine cyclo-ligase n=1 Tax=Salinisphaera orenii YIM 95161 TaxID=1051139 RepID=A0A423Q9H2_9GAMM|nr:phosphoribosylformylglycinamidine cyclo-ligase [Salinisphaera halophila]ROO36751.1 phosphoribosylaminoimidazole synthetase [Salinisphaera halophila YIM 95161]